MISFYPFRPYSAIMMRLPFHCLINLFHPTLLLGSAFFSSSWTKRYKFTIWLMTSNRIWHVPSASQGGSKDKKKSGMKSERKYLMCRFMRGRKYFILVSNRSGIKFVSHRLISSWKSFSSVCDANVKLFIQRLFTRKAKASETNCSENETNFIRRSARTEDETIKL